MECHSSGAVMAQLDTHEQEMHFRVRLKLPELISAWVTLNTLITCLILASAIFSLSCCDMQAGPPCQSAGVCGPNPDEAGPAVFVHRAMHSTVETAATQGTFHMFPSLAISNCAAYHRH